MAVELVADKLGSARFTRGAFLLGSFGVAASVAGIRPRRALATADIATTADACGWVPWQAAHLLTRSEFRDTAAVLAAGGYRPMRISVYEVDGVLRIAGIWELRPESERRVHIALSKGEMKETNARYEKGGYRLRAIEGCGVAGSDTYSGIWERATGGEPKLELALKAQQCREKLSELSADGFAVVNVSGFEFNGEPRFAVLWQKRVASSAVAEIEMSESGFRETHDSKVAQGKALVDVSAYRVGAATSYAAIWETAGRATEIEHSTGAGTLDRNIDDRRYRGHLPVMVDGYGVGSQPRYASVWRREGVSRADEDALATEVETYLREYSVPGVSLAFAKDGRLVYARGFGFADRSTGASVTVHSRFRIASSSKPITAVAIMRLVDQRKLTLGDTVLGPGSLLGTDYGAAVDWTSPSTARMRTVRVGHLLEHTAGWPNTSSSENPMASPVRVTEDDEAEGWPPWEGELDREGLIDYVITNSTVGGEWALQYPPGDRFAYSGFGFLLLARIIERVSGMAYEEYVTQEIVNDPDSTLEMSSRDGLLPNEVSYPQQGAPRSWMVWRRAGGGGWVASAIDLVRFMTRADGEPTRVDAISAAALERMLWPSMADDGEAQGLGWFLDADPLRSDYDGVGVDYWHGGKLPSSNSVIARATRDGSRYCWAAVSNGLTDPESDLDVHMRKWFALVQTWPCLDAF